MAPTFETSSQIAGAVAAWIYLGAIWNRHAASTLNSPEKRTLYDFLQTRPSAFYALALLFVLMMDLIRKQ